MSNSSFAGDVSVIIPTWNRPSLLSRVLESLAAQSTDRRFEVIIVENGSVHTTSLADRFPTFHFLRLPERGVCAARNAGALHAQGALLIFLDDDIIPCSDFVESHARVHNDNEKRVGIGGSRFAIDQDGACLGMWL